MSRSIILTGPDGAGKGPVGKLVAETVGLPVIALTEENKKFYVEQAFDPAGAERLMSVASTLSPGDNVPNLPWYPARP